MAGKWCKILNYWSARNISGPKPIPLFGNNLSHILKLRATIDMEWYNTYGTIFGVYDCAKPVLYVSEPALIKQILVKQFHTFRNRSLAPVLSGPVSLAIPRANDSDWKRIRAIASPTFTARRLRHMYPALDRCCAHFLAALARDVSASGGNREVNLKQLMNAYTLDAIATTAFAIKTDSYTDPNNPFIATANRISNLIFSTNDWHKILAMILPTFLTNNSMWKWMASTGGGTDDQFFNDVARRLMSERKESAEKHTDFLQLLMDVEREDDNSDPTAGAGATTTGAGNAMVGNHVNEGADELIAGKQAFSGVVAKKLTADEILAQCSLFFTAGYETTALTLTYCTYELAVNPDIQDRLVAEINDAAINEGIDYDTLCLRLPLLDAVVSETLRKYPTDSRLERRASDDTVLSAGGRPDIHAAKGVVIKIPTYAIHHSPDNFPD
ncbi:unnamed protein product, partial [Medioppia subpectinata]